jgi:hypothetical protein
MKSVSKFKRIFIDGAQKKANMAARNLTKLGKGLDTKSQSLIISAQKSIVTPQQ